MDEPHAMRDDIQDSISSHQGTLEGLPDRSDYSERLKLWCQPAFLDAYCYGIIANEQGGFIRRTLWNRMNTERQKRPYKEVAEEYISTEAILELITELSAIRMSPFKQEPFMICDAANVGIVYRGANSRIDLTWTSSVSKDWRKIEKWFDATTFKLDQYFPDKRQD